MAVYADQAITLNSTRGDFGYDIVQWLIWDDENVYCAQFVKNGEQWFGVSRKPYQDWVKRNTHEGPDGRSVKVIGKLAGVPLHGKGPVEIIMETNDRFLVKVVGAVVDAHRYPRSRRHGQRDVRTNAMR